MKFNGYERPDGSVGVRNILLVLAVADCSEPVARMIAEEIYGAFAITQHYGCIPGQMVANTLIGVGENPNVAAVLLVGMGCEGMPAHALGKTIKRSGKPVEWISIQELGGTHNALTKGKQILKGMSEKISRLKRKEFDISKLIIGVKCGGSDTTSGLAGNPAVGAFVDMLIDAGGAAIMSEPIEAVGAEEPLAKRALNEEVKKQIYKMIGDEEKRWSVPGAQMEFMCKGNVDGGLTTIEEKSLGAIHKSGSRPIVGVLENSDRLLEKVPEGAGFYLQDGTHMEPMAMSFMAAAGAQMVIFVTGCGGTFGHAIVPMIKVTGNPETYSKMPGDMDINAGTIITGEESIDSVGRRIFDEVIEVASGKATLGETLGYHNFSVYRRDPRLEALLKISK
ncbi:MAG: UxaA family hydrolase [Deltaproteobacteria bacterium]|nr:UxaA family hydrolase [Deltaproteobacteria bacterium]